MFIFSIFLIGIVVYAVWENLNGQSTTTEDAYVEGNLVQVTTQVSGTVTHISADNTDYVQQGDSLVTINPVDARLALEKAKSQLATAVRQVRNQYATLEELKASIAVGQTSLDKARADFTRRSGLRQSIAISAEELAHSRDALNNAQAALNVTIRQYQAAQTLTQNTTLQTHPDVLEAESALREAWLDYHRTQVIAPVGGVVAQRKVQVGQHVTAGASMMSVVPLDSVWVTANFKETQLGELRAGHQVTLISDIYGRDVRYHGRVIGIEPGTGSAFSLLPAQNATGNWIKVVQRVPVRITLDPKELRQHPLRPGLSMKVSVDTRSKGTPLSALPTRRQRWSTPVYEQEDAQATAIIQEILKQNG
ncbi:Inner membrane protein yibH [Serratia ficaria]|uniref:Inner membrane protein yibH n=2 Tax=Serratia ficaria TaxID=61651 RepID=A0A240ALD0_SERFI|nr:Inner membrane protein yibH [Serratia ficaria]CAI0956225.1 Inner membrane protein yibH [Serratia ficaria]CAI1040736.1 Inner membrane protein yibH [Serratia ficaria]CAI2063345.1 Inner membrane protein yibH [Serratia ficaria]SNV84215.1 Inner membrane protein yibH [Serratia ficaria]